MKALKQKFIFDALTYIQSVYLLIFLFISYNSLAQYCAPTLKPLSGNYGLTNVTLNTINNNTATQQGYIDYSASIGTTLYKNGTYSISITAGQSTQIALCWIDWNQDFDFDDQGESYNMGTGILGGATVTLNFTVPLSAMLGTTRLRVASGATAIYPSLPNACGVPNALMNGCVEDYALIIAETNMVFDSCTTKQGIYHNCLLAPQSNALIISEEIYTSFTLNSLTSTSFTFNTFGTSATSDIARARLFFTGLSPIFTPITQFGSDVISPSGTFIIKGNVSLQPGKNHFWLVYDITGTPGNFIDASCTLDTIDGVARSPIVQNPGAGFQINIPTNYCAAKRTNTWLFGNKAGIDFNCSSPKPILNSALTFSEGSGCMSDNNGSLLFVTEGNKVYDKTQSLMPLGNINATGAQASQPVIIVPDPGNSNRFYLFTAPDSPASMDSLYYSVLDMSLTGNGTIANPYGDLVPGKIKIGLFDSCMQNVIAVPHCNKKDYWVIARRFNSNAFYVYDISATGISAPIISNIGNVMPSASHTQMKASPNGKKIAYPYSELSGTGVLQLFDFDNTTGIISNFASISLPDRVYGTSFSPDNTKLYVSGQHGTFLFQYDICAGNAASIQASEYHLAIGAPSGTHIQEGMQLAPDGKIYGTRYTKDSLHVIQNPNLSGALCNYTRNNFYLGSTNLTNKFSLPNFIDADFLDCNAKLTADKLGFTNTSVCLGDTTFFIDTSQVLQTYCFADVRTFSWNFGDPLSGTANTSTLKNPKHLYTQAGTFVVMLAVEEGCQADTIYKTINVDNLPLISISGNNTFCSGLSTSLSATGGNTYTWQPSGGLSSTSTSVVIASPISPITYTVLGTNINGCENTDTISLIVHPLPLVTSSPFVAICPGDSATLTTNGALTYMWFPLTGLTNTTGSTVTARPSSPTNYTVAGTDINGCTNFTITSVNINPRPVIVISGDTSICVGASSTLTAFGASSYMWSPASGLSSSQGSIVTVTPSGITAYFIIGVDANGCKDTIPVNFTMNNIPTANAGPNDTICPGETILITASGGQSYLWNTGATSASIIVNPTGDITYSVVAFNGNCSDSDEVNVHVNFPPIVDAGSNINIIAGTSVTLSASGSGTFSWYPSQGLSCTNCKTPAASPQLSTKYYVTITDMNGCTALDSVIVSIDMPCGNIYIPNAFSPNEDGENDIFFVKANCVKKVLFAIYNRWGEKVFETSDITTGWDGKFKNKEVETNVFVYKLYIKLISGEEILRQGNISLVK